MSFHGKAIADRPTTVHRNSQESGASAISLSGDPDWQALRQVHAWVYRVGKDGGSVIGLGILTDVVTKNRATTSVAPTLRRTTRLSRERFYMPRDNDSRSRQGTAMSPHQSDTESEGALTPFRHLGSALVAKARLEAARNVANVAHAAGGTSMVASEHFGDRKV